MLIGTFFAPLGPKRRVAIPKKLLRQLGKKIIIAKWYESCLVVVGEYYWQALLKRLTGEAKTITQGVRDTDRFILGSAFELTPDNQGRVVIPKPLAEYSALTNQVVFLGLGDRVEIWNKELWQEREKYIQKHAGEMVEKLAEKNKKGG